MIRARLREEAGETLAELLMSIAIMSIAFTAVLGGLATAVMTSGEHRSQATANTVLVSAAEAVKSQTANEYVACAATGSYSPVSGVSLPSGWSSSNVAVTGVRYWNGSSFVAGCSGDQKLQLITLAVNSPDGKASESTSVVKRNPV